MKLLKTRDLNRLFPGDYPVVFLHAHPDDEAFLNIGLISALSHKGRKCSIIYCAAGANPNDQNSIVRQKEAKNVGKYLNISVDFLSSHDSGSLSDNSCSQKDIESFIGEYYDCLYRLTIMDKPYILISYDRVGGYGHIDHIKTHEIGRKILRRSIAGNVIYFESTINRDGYTNWIKLNSSVLQSNQLPELKYWSTEFGTSESGIVYKYELTNEEIRIKRKTLSMYKSQISSDHFPLTLSLEDFKLLFGYEFLNT